MLIKNRRIAVVIALVLMVGAGCSKRTTEKEKGAEIVREDIILFVGTYTETEAHAEGIYVYKFNTETGALTYSSTSPKIINPSYLAVHPSKEFVYAVNETGGEGDDITGSVSAFKVDPVTAELSLINQVSSGGDWPCHISIDATGEFALVANYGGSVSMFPLKEDGSIGKTNSIIEHQGSGPTDRQKGPHAHMIITSRNNNLAYAVDLGADQIFSYKIDTTEKELIPVEPGTNLVPGTGPRHMTFHPELNTAYVINELSGTITGFNVDVSGGLSEFQTISTLPEGSEEFAACADIQIHPSGKYLYASNRGKVNNIAIYEISTSDGSLKLRGHQSTFGNGPRSFVIDPAGAYLLVANQNTSNVFTFKIDPQTGLLNDNPVETKTPTPVCLKFM
ncbi:MAG: lactonase family protein [Bacteroidota bacterium]